MLMRARAGRRWLRVLVVAVIAVAGTRVSVAQAPKQALVENRTPKPVQIDRNGVLILIRSALLALDQANKTGNKRCCAISARRDSRSTPRRGLRRSSPISGRTTWIFRVLPRSIRN